MYNIPVKKEERKRMEGSQTERCVDTKETKNSNVDRLKSVLHNKKCDDLRVHEREGE